MLKKSLRTLLPAAVLATTFGFTPLTAQAAVGELLGQLPTGEISCEQAAAHWTSDGDYQARVAQAQTLAAIDPRGGQILAALGRVDAAAEHCGLKGTVSTDNTGGAEDTDAAETPAEGAAGGAVGTAETPETPATPGAGTGSPAQPAAPAPGGGGTPEAPVTDAEAVLGPIRNQPAVPTKTIEVLGQGQVEVADADAMMSNFLRQFTIII